MEMLVNRSAGPRLALRTMARRTWTDERGRIAFKPTDFPERRTRFLPKKISLQLLKKNFEKSQENSQPLLILIFPSRFHSLLSANFIQYLTLRNEILKLFPKSIFFNLVYVRNLFEICFGAFVWLCRPKTWRVHGRSFTFAAPCPLC